MEQANAYPARLFKPTSTRAFNVLVRVEAGNLSILSDNYLQPPIHWATKNIFSITKERGKIVLKYGSESDLEILEVNHPYFDTELKEKNPYLIKINHSFNPAYLAISFSLLFFIGLVALAYFLIIPFLIGKLTDAFPKKTEVSMGKKMLGAFILHQKINKEASININKFYSHLNFSTDYKINITVVDSDVKNAFAIPGGEIVVYSKILESIKSYPELAALLGHETGHIQHRHSLKLIIKNISFQLVLSAVLQDYGNISEVMIAKAGELEELSYNRLAEEDADRFGYAMLKKNKIDPKGITRLFDRLKDEDGMHHKTPEFLLTHPKLESRIVSMEKLIKDSPYPILENDSLRFYWNKIDSLPH